MAFPSPLQIVCFAHITIEIDIFVVFVMYPINIILLHLNDGYLSSMSLDWLAQNLSFFIGVSSIASAMIDSVSLLVLIPR